MFHGVLRKVFLATLLLSLTPAALAQSAVDRIDTSTAREELREEQPVRDEPRQAPRIEQSNARAASASSQPVLVGAIRVEGAVVLRPADFAPVIEPWLGRQLSAADLRRLATDIANVARRAGYGLATAWIPPQTVTNGILRVAIDEGRIDAVEAEGSAKANVERLLARLVGSRPVRTADLERQLLLAGDVAGVSVNGARIEKRNGRNILRVQTRQVTSTGRASLDNWGSSTNGPVRARLDFNFNGAIMRGDHVSVSAVVTPLNPSEFQFLRAAYTVPVGRSGTEASLAAYLGHSRPGASLASQNLEGTSIDVEATLSHPLLRSRAASLWASGQIGLRDSKLDRDGVRVREDRLATISAGVNGVRRTGDGWLRARLQLVQGIDVLGATEAGDPLASRTDGSAIFTKLAFSAHYAARIAPQTNIAIGMEGQLASRPLLASEEMGLGGRTFLRGYDYREVSGDRGAAASAELRFDLKSLPKRMQRAQVYAYADVGTVSNLRDGTGGGTLASAGGGVRIWLRKGIEAGLEVGVPLRKSPFGADSNPRLSFNLAYAL